MLLIVNAVQYKQMKKRSLCCWIIAVFECGDWTIALRSGDFCYWFTVRTCRVGLAEVGGWSAGLYAWRWRPRQTAGETQCHRCFCQEGGQVIWSCFFYIVQVSVCICHNTVQKACFLLHWNCLERMQYSSIVEYQLQFGCEELVIRGDKPTGQQSTGHNNDF